MKNRILLSFVFILAFASGCATANQPKVTGSSWILTTYNDQQSITDHQPILKFETDQVSVTTGCNHYGGNFQIDEDSIHFEGIFNTEMACLEPEGLMEQERIYLDLLRRVDQYELEGESLTFYIELNPVLVFPAIAKIMAGIIVLLIVAIIFGLRFFFKKQFGV